MAIRKGRMKKTIVALIGLYLLLYILPLGARPLFIPDEVRYFEIPREMIASGDWVVPRLNGIRYFEKPVFGYWINALSMTVFGQNAFAVRFSSALSVAISALAVFFLCRRFSGNRSVGILASAILLTSLLVLGVGTFSVLDSLVSMLLTVALAAFFYAYTAGSGSQSRRLLWIAGGLCGMAFLTKGFLAFAVPVAVIVPFMIWERRFKTLLSTAWIPVTAAVLVSLPWSLMIHFREGDFWRYFFWVEHIERFFSSNGGQHPEPIWYYLPLIFAGALPWSVLWPAAVQGLRKMDRSDALIQFAACWLLFPFLFFSLSSGKLITYLLPCFPPLAILTAVGLLNFFQAGKTRLFTSGAFLLGAVVAVIAAAVAVNQATGFAGIRPFGPSETWKWVSGCAGLGLWAAMALSSARARTVAGRLGWFAVAPFLLFIVAHFIMPDMTLERKAPGAFLTRHLDRIAPETTIVANGDLVRAVSSFFKRDDVYMIQERNELKYGLAYEDTKHRFLDPGQLKRLIERKTAGTGGPSSAKQSVILVTKADKLNRIMHMLPEPAYADQYGNFNFMQF